MVAPHITRSKIPLGHPPPHRWCFEPPMARDPERGLYTGIASTNRAGKISKPLYGESIPEYNQETTSGRSTMAVRELPKLRTWAQPLRTVTPLRNVSGTPFYFQF